MSGPPPRHRPSLAAAAALSLLAACGAGGDPAASSDATRSASDGSARRAPSPPELVPAAERSAGTPVNASVRPRLIRRDDSYVYALEAGTGPAAVVLIHGSGTRGLCVWSGEIPWLAKAGFRVLAIDLPCIGNSTCPPGPARPLAAVTDVVRSIRADDLSAKVAVVAASAGGPIAIHLAGRPDSGIATAVALSPAGIDGELREDGADLPTTQAASRVTVPMLLVSARDDRSVDQPTLAGLRDRAGSNLTVTVVGEGSGHAQELLYSGDPDTGRPSAFRRALLRFLADHLESPG